MSERSWNGPTFVDPKLIRLPHLPLEAFSYIFLPCWKTAGAVRGEMENVPTGAMPQMRPDHPQKSRIILFPEGGAEIKMRPPDMRSGLRSWRLVLFLGLIKLLGMREMNSCNIFINGPTKHHVVLDRKSYFCLMFLEVKYTFLDPTYTSLGTNWLACIWKCANSLQKVWGW